MKILIDGHFLDGRKHGVAVYLERLYTQYRKLQDADELHIGIEPNNFCDYPLFNMPNVHVHPYRFGGVLRFLYDIPRLAMELEPDIIHAQYVMPIKGACNAMRHVTLHDVLYEDFPEMFSPIYRWSRKIVFGWSARRADLVTTVSDYSRSRIAELYGRASNSIHIIYSGVVDDDCDSCIPQGRERKNFILYVSRFEKRKNHLTLLRAFLQVKQFHPQLRLTLIGFDVDGTLAVVQSFIEEHGLAGSIDIRRDVSDAELNDLYLSAAVVVYPSLGEGFGMPVIEAFLLNPNTLFSNATAMAEFDFAPDNSFDPTSCDELTSKISRMLAEPDAGYDMWRVQRLEVIKRYNWSNSARQLIDLYHGGDVLRGQPLKAK